MFRSRGLFHYNSIYKAWGVKICEKKIAMQQGSAGKILRISAIEGAPAQEIKQGLAEISMAHKNSVIFVTLKTAFFQSGFVRGMSPGHIHMYITDHEGKEHLTLSKRADTSKRLKTMRSIADPRVPFSEVAVFAPLFTDHAFEMEKWSNSKHHDIYFHVVPFNAINVSPQALMHGIKWVINTAEPYQLMSGLNQYNQIVFANNCVQACYQAIGHSTKESQYDPTPQVATVELMKPYVQNIEAYMERAKEAQLVTDHELDKPMAKPASKNEEDGPFSLVM